ncbi:MAG: hypothetical protein ABIO88_04795 [Burkholderiaceae bacterium]
MKKRPVLLIAMFSLVPSAFAALGDLSTDLVFVPVTPCRIFDTRPSQGGSGPIAAGGTKDFIVSGTSTYATQGGSATNCGVLDGSNVAAAAINTTVVTPATGGYITAYPLGATLPLAATVNFNAGDIRGNMAIVKVSQTGGLQDLSIYSSSLTNVVGDIVGYFTRPAATALECVTTTPATLLAIAASGGTGTIAAAACPATYTSTGTECTSSSYDMQIVQVAGGTCSAQNYGSTTANLTASQRCCRIPGR